MALFTVELSPEHRAKLDSLRAEMGLRSEAEALRFIIMFGHPMPREEVGRVMRSIGERVFSTPVSATEMYKPAVGKPIAVPLIDRKPFNPQPKKGKK